MAILALAALFLAPQADAAPRVIASSPAQGAVVASGKAKVRVTFDQRMDPMRYSFVAIDAATYPPCARQAHVLSDFRTFEIECTLEPNHAYAIGINLGRFNNFRGANGQMAQPTTLRFSTR